MRGRVVDPGGKALAGVEVTARHVADWHKASVQTLAHGSFAFPCVPIGRHTVMAYHADRQLAIMEVDAPACSPLVIRLANANQRTVRVRVLGATKEQLQRATCHLHAPEVDLPAACRRGALDEHGIWEVRGLPNEVMASVHVAIPEAHVEPGHAFCHAHPDSGCFELVFTCKPRRLRELRGRLVSAHGAPFANTQVEVRSNYGGDATTISEHDGRFRVRSAAPDGDVIAFVLGPGAFVLDGPGLAEYVSPVHRGKYVQRMPVDHELELVAVAAATVRVRCRLHDGTPAAYAFAAVWCEWQAPNGRHTSQLATGTTDDAGEVVFSKLHPGVDGTVFVTVQGAGWQAKGQPVVLLAGAAVDVVLDAPPTGAIEGLVRDARGEPLAGQAIGAFPAAGERAEHPTALAVSDHAGRFRIASLACGLWRLGAARPDRPTVCRGAAFPIEAAVTLQRDVVVAAPPR
jgi:hypothetical protein